MKIGIALLISSLLIFVVMVGACLYFIGGISATIPPIRYYDYQGKEQQLIDALQSYQQNHSDIDITISPRNKLADNGIMDIKVEFHNPGGYKFLVTCKPEDGSKTEVKLVSAFDIHHNGGYRIKAKGVRNLINYFEGFFLRELDKEEKIKLNPDTSFWRNFSIY